MEYGYVRISRKAYASDPWWTEKRVFSRWEAWEDLIQRAAWQDHRRMVEGQLVELRRGEVVGSLRFFADAWGWSHTKVRRMIDQCIESDRLALQRTLQVGNVYLLVNYELYQGADPATIQPAFQSRYSKRNTDHSTERYSETVANTRVTVDGDTAGVPASVPRTLQREYKEELITTARNARAREDSPGISERLRLLLGPEAHPAIDRLTGNTGSDAWASEVWGWYRPRGAMGATDGGGTQLRDFVGLDSQEALAALSTAIDDYAADGAAFNRKNFRGFVRAAAREERRRRQGQEPGRQRVQPPPDMQDYGDGTTEFKGFNR